MDGLREGRIRIERAGTSPAARVVRLRFRRHQQPRGREGHAGRSGQASPGHHRGRRLPRVQPFRDQRRGRHRGVPPFHPHVAGVPLRGRRHLLLRRRPAAGGGRQLSGRAVRGRAHLGRRDAARDVPQRPGPPRQQERRSPSGDVQGRQQPAYKWFFETTTPVEGHMHAIVRTIAEAQTKFQHVEIMETASYGKALVLDGRIQSSQADEFIYHEALVHPGLLAVDRRAAHSALVIGGGEGATLREILAVPSITEGGHGRHRRARWWSSASATCPRCTRAPSTTPAPSSGRGRPRLSREHHRALRPDRGRPGRAAGGGPGLPALHAASSTRSCAIGSRRAAP